MKLLVFVDVSIAQDVSFIGKDDIVGDFSIFQCSVSSVIETTGMMKSLSTKKYTIIVKNEINVLLNDALKIFYLQLFDVKYCREETRFSHYLGYCFQLVARVIVYAHQIGLCYDPTVRDQSDDSLHLQRTLYHSHRTP